MRQGIVTTAAAGMLAFVLGGCASATRESLYWNRVFIKGTTNTDTTTQSMAESVRGYNASLDKDARGLLEDIDLAMMRDRPTRLTRWHDR